MLEDRDYMRQPAYQEPRLTLTVWLLILNVACFLIESLASSSSLRNVLFIQQHLALSLDGLRHGFFWELLTYQFLHAGWVHLLFNCLAIFFFGRSVETMIGGGRFLVLYFSSGIIGGVVQMLVALAMPEHFGGSVVGASAGASGLIAAFAVLTWQDRFTLLLYFIPVTMTGRTLFWISVALAVVGILTPGSSVANAAHLGGIVTGFFYVHYFVQGRWSSDNFTTRRSPPREFVTRLKENKFWRGKAAPPAEELSADEFLQQQVDPILDKISAQGIQSLTAREREILENARKKMTRS
ncbi:MAG: rhomboid family intramembrane serine protease [Limisphaerales bacterium]